MEQELFDGMLTDYIDKAMLIDQPILFDRITAMIAYGKLQESTLQYM